MKIANHGIEDVAPGDPVLAKGLSTLGGDLVSEPVAAAHGLSYTDPTKILDHSVTG